MKIKQKQWQLFYLGYYGESTADIDGLWGPKSEQATTEFQSAVGIKADGVFGTHTRNKTKEVISAIQKIVSGSGGKTLVIDGLAGPATMTATVWYQKQHGLTPNGLASGDLLAFVHNGCVSDPVETLETDELIWNFLLTKGLTPAGAAGLMGNLEAESALRPNNLQNSYERSLGYTDESYTAAVDNGVYNDFVNDCAGYGLAQWTYRARKAALLDFCESSGRSIGDLNAQLEFLYKELSESYSGLLAKLKATTSIKEASDLVLTQFERPADMGDSVKEKRAAFGNVFLSKFVHESAVEPETSHSWWDEIEYFTRDELKCKCGGQFCNGFPAEPQEMAVRLADRARKHFGRPAHNVSFLRCRQHNANSGGVANSQHMYGEAMDIRIDGVTANDLYSFMKKQPEVRYTYKINERNVHFDIAKGAR